MLGSVLNFIQKKKWGGVGNGIRCTRGWKGRYFEGRDLGEPLLEKNF